MRECRGVRSKCAVLELKRAARPVAPGEGEARDLVLGSGLVVGAAAPRHDSRRACLGDRLDRKYARPHWWFAPARRSALRHLCRGRGACAVYLGLEAAAWAGLYLWLGASTDWRDAMLYSLGAITSYGHAEVFLESRWRLLGAIEAVNGVILFGLTTAFLYAAIHEVWPVRRD
jgi:hypothetical protein